VSDGWREAIVPTSQKTHTERQNPNSLMNLHDREGFYTNLWVKNLRDHGTVVATVG
jgi:hypothetical protein